MCRIVKSRFSNNDITAEVDILPYELQHDDYGPYFDQELLEIEENIRTLQTKIDKYDQKIERQTNHADKVDYIVAASCGLLTGLIDAFFIGDSSHAQELGKTPVNEIVEKIAKKNGYKGEKGLEGSITFLEKKFKSPSDDIWKGQNAIITKASKDGVGKRISDYSHHLDDYSHHPSIIGLLCSVLTQFTEVGYFQNRDGVLFQFQITDKGLIGTSFWGKIGAGIINWFGHLVSDIAGSKSTPSAGMGIPGPFLSLAKELAALPGLRDSGLPNTLYHMFKDRNVGLSFDLRCEIGQSIPVLINVCLVTVFYMIRRMVIAIRKYSSGEKVSIKDIIPSKNRTYARMMTVASGVFVATDMADAGIRSAIKSGGNPALAFANFVTRINIVGIGQFAISLVMDARMGIKKEISRNRRIKAYSELIALTNTKVAYEERGVWIEAQNTEQALIRTNSLLLEAMQVLSESWKEISKDYSNLSDQRDDIERNNPGLLSELSSC